MPGLARALHQVLSQIVGPVLLVCAATGSLWALTYRQLGWEKADCKWMMAFHQLDFVFGGLEYLRDNGAGLLGGQAHHDDAAAAAVEVKSTVYYREEAPLGLGSVPLTKAWRMPTFVAVLALVLLHAGLGATMLASPSSKQVKQQRSAMRWLHHLLALFIGLPLVIVAASGALYRILRIDGRIEKADLKWLLQLHQGWFDWAIPIFPVVFGVLVLVFSVAGLLLTPTGMKATKCARKQAGRKNKRG